MALAAAKLKASGHKCPFTTELDQLDPARELLGLAQRRVRDQEQRPAAALDTRLAFNSPLHVRHIENLANMAKQGLFVYKGRDNSADATFRLGRVRHDRPARRACSATSSKNAKFAYGVAPLPYYPDVPGAPQNTVIGGASLWVMSGKKPDEYKGVAAFFNYLSSPEVQSASHKRTGYLPITTAAFKLTEQVGFYKENPGTDVAVNQMIRKTTDKSRGIRLGNFLQIRTIIDEELEQVWAGKKTRQGGARQRRQARQRAARSFQAANKAEPRSRRSDGDAAWPIEKRVVFRSPGCPGCCSRRRWPSSCVFFFWPAAQALLQSCSSRTRSAPATEWVGLENFAQLFQRPELPRVVQDHGDLLGRWSRSSASPSRCCWRFSPTASSAARSPTRRC